MEILECNSTLQFVAIPFPNKGISDFFLLNVVGSYDKYTHDAFNTYNLQYLNGTSNDEYRNRYQPKQRDTITTAQI